MYPPEMQIKIEAIKKKFGRFDPHTLYIDDRVGGGVMNPMEIYLWCENLSCRCNVKEHPRYNVPKNNGG